MLEAKNLTYIYGAGTPFETRALDDVSLTIEDGQFMGVIGHTGSGKSTLIQHLNGLLKPQQGRILLDGADIWGKGKPGRAVRFQVGLVFQYPEYQLFEETVARDIAFGPRNQGLSDGEVDQRVREALDFVGLPASLGEKSPFDLSGGQKRRVAIAGVIAMRPRVLVLDEPTAGLDPAGRREILSRIRRYRAQTGAAVVLVTHSMEDIARTVDTLTVLSEGRVAMAGPLADVFSRRDLLRSIGLDVPAVTQVLLRLAAMGLEIDTSCYTVEAAAQAIRRAGVPRA